MPTENLRSVLVIALFVVVFLLWQAWLTDYGPKSATETEKIASPDSAAEPAPSPAEPEFPEQPQAIGAPSVPVGDVEQALPAGTVHVRTDLFDLNLDGRVLQRLDLLAYPVTITAPDKAFPLLHDSLPDLFSMETGLLGSNGEPSTASVLAPQRSEYVLGDDQDTLDVAFQLLTPSGIRLEKVYRFHRGSYVIEVLYRVKNATGMPWTGRLYGQFKRTRVVSKGGLFRVYTYTGGVISSPDKPYEKVKLEKIAEQPLDRDVTGGWAAMIQHYFAGAWVPNPEVSNHYSSKALDNGVFLLRLYSDHVVEPGESRTLKLTAYIGPKIQDRMEKVAPGLRRTVDFGWLFFIAEPLFWLLQHIHGVLGNWGWSIITLTILIKLIFFHLSATSYKSMARMRKLQPRMVQIRERYGSDKQRMNQAMMELYKKEKVNPLGGCLPILVQIPVFISLYWVLLESVELRQASFIFWLHDLSQYDPYFVLPILMGISMLMQQRLNPTPPDPIQAKVMMALPFIFTFFFLFFPSGLVLYWIVNNVLSIAQQWVITKRIEAGP